MDECNSGVRTMTYCLPKIKNMGGNSVPVVCGIDIGHSLLADGVGPFTVVKGVKLRKQVALDEPVAPYYPFAGRDEWQAVTGLLNAAGVARLGLCDCAILIWPSRRLRLGDMQIEDMLCEFVQILSLLFDGEFLKFEEDDFLFPCGDCGICNRSLIEMRECFAGSA